MGRENSEGCVEVSLRIFEESPDLVLDRGDLFESPVNQSLEGLLRGKGDRNEVLDRDRVVCELGGEERSLLSSESPSNDCAIGNLSEEREEGCLLIDVVLFDDCPLGVGGGECLLIRGNE